MANGDTKTEAMLNVLGNGGTGDEFRGCCNTKTQSYILDAIDRINAIQPGGTSDFNDLENRPQLNGTAMTGNTNITNFTGTDGTNAGAQGLVPAPAAADIDKFLKSDGTWATAGGGGDVSVVKTLTEADYNYPADNPTQVALWLLPTGFYRRGSLESSRVLVATSIYLGGGEVAFVGLEGSFGVPIYCYGFVSSSIDGNVICSWYSVIKSIGVAIFQGEVCKSIDDLTSTSAQAPLSANQGRILDEKISALEARVTALEGGNSSQNSSSSEDPGTSAEPDPGVIAPTVTCPFCGSETSADSPICENCGSDMTSAPHDPGNGGGEPGPEIQPEEPTEEPVEG